MSFLPPKWDVTQAHYSIDMTEDYKKDTDKYLVIVKDTHGGTSFLDSDALHNTTDALITLLIDEGKVNKWFSKLPSHDQLMKRVRHTFSSLAIDTNTHAVVSSVYMTPKLLTFQWTPVTVALEMPL